MKRYVDRLSGEHARRNSVSAFAAEAFMNKCGLGWEGATGGTEIKPASAHAVLVMSIGLLVGCGGGEGPIVPPPPTPAEYADKHMPADWWGDASKLEEGRKLYLGETNPDVNCASCHGKDGKPVKAGARDFRNAERMKLWSDSAWFWRIAEGVANTKMKGWKGKLSEEDIWKLVLFERSFALSGKSWSEEKKQWVDAGNIAVALADAKEGLNNSGF